MKEMSEQFKNPLEEAPESGLFSGLHHEEINQIRESVAQNHKLSHYYEDVKKLMCEESGLPAVHRGQILNRMHEILSQGGTVESGLAEELEKIVRLNKKESTD